MMKRAGILLFFALALSNVYLSASGQGAAASMGRQAGTGESELIIRRAEMPIHSGFKEWVYVDGVQKLALANGETGKIIVANGNHTIHAELYTITSEKIRISVQSNITNWMITPYSMNDFAIEPADDDAPVLAQAARPAQTAKSSPAAKAAPAKKVSTDNSVEGSLSRAADLIMGKIPEKAKLAIVYVTAKDPDVTEFIANELEFIMVGEGRILVDRSQLDRIRKEQNFQISGEVDDKEAVSIGKMAGANVIITGSVTGSGSLRRLRLRALDTQSAQVLTAASEKF
jgi:hypothetical protein